MAKPPHLAPAHECGAAVPQNFTSLDWFAPRAITPTKLTSKGSLVQFDPIPRHELGLPASYRWLSQDFVGHHAIASHGSNTTWQQVGVRMKQHARLNVALLGFSTLAGCGARDHDAGRLKLRCDPAYSWSRRFHDSLLARLANQLSFQRVDLRTSTFYKNGVGVSFFEHCITSMLPRDADVVLLEAGSNLFEFTTPQAVQAALASVLRALQVAAPLAAVVFVTYVPQRDNAMRALVTSSAAALHVDHIDMMRLQQSLAQVVANCSAHWSAKASYMALRPDFFAGNGSDHHPTRAGHELLGEIASYHLMQRVRSAVQGSGPGLGRAAVPTVLPPLKAEPQKPPLQEQCFNQANEIPLHRANGTWQLVDEGGAKGVQKLGWLSSKIGESIEFAAPHLSCRRNSPRRTSTCLTVRLGYLLSTREGQGTMRVSCLGGGCACSNLNPTKAKYGRSLAPYPFIPTDARVAGETDRDFAGLNLSTFGKSISVTATTEFTLKRESGAPADGDPCLIRVTHDRYYMAFNVRSMTRVASNLGLTTDELMAIDKTRPSRVRIDSMGVRCEPSCESRFFPGYEPARPRSEYDPKYRG